MANGGLILETTFLIDLERERHRRARGPAHRFLERHAEKQLHLTPTVAGELAAGAEPGELDRWQHLVEKFTVLPIDLDVCWEYGQIYRHLKANGLLIGSNDLWIAATAVAHRLPLVTRNEKHFRRVPGLELRSYRD